MITKKSFINLILVYLLVFVSGSSRYLMSPDKLLVVAFLVSLLAWALFSDRTINDKFILYVSVFCSFLLALSLYTGGSLGLGVVVSNTMKLVLAYLIVKTVGREFTDTFITIMVVLAVASLFGYLSDMFGLLDSVVRKLPRLGENAGYDGILFAFRRRYLHGLRNGSIFFEPGAYQGFLNATLFLLFFVKTQFSEKKKWIYVAVLLTALYTTYSVTGYLIFVAMFGLLLVKGNVLSRKVKAVLVGLILMATIIFFQTFQHILIERIQNYTSIEDITDGSLKRSKDALVDLEIFKRHIFGIGYKKYNEEWGLVGVASGRAGSKASNGITKILAIYGLPFFLFYFGSYYWAIGRLLDRPGLLMNIVPLGMLMMYMWGEAWYMFAPICLAIISAAFVYRSVPQDVGVERDAKIAQ